MEMNLIDFSNFTYEECLSMLDALQVECEARREEKKEQMWNTVVKALNAYIKEFGVISFESGDGDFLGSSSEPWGRKGDEWGTLYV